VTDYTKPESKSAIAEKALKCFKRASEAWQKQRDREKDDLRFQVPEMQWDEGAKRQRQGMTVDGVPTPARPILSIPKLDQPRELVKGQQRSAHLGISIHPISEEADDDTAEMIQGLYRGIERDGAHMARSWAFSRGVDAGMGWYRINTEYDEYGGDPLDQKITIRRILDGSSVVIDPGAEEADFSDAEFAFIKQWMSCERFESLYPKAKSPAADKFLLELASEQSPDWVTMDGQDTSYLVAEYWWKVREVETVPAKDADGNQVDRKREVVRVMWAKLAPGGDEGGLQFLEGPQEWNGKLIPLIPVIGRELIPFDGERRWTGMIGPAKDAQRLYNYAASSAVEMAALEPKAPFIGVEGQFEGHESEWQQANLRNWPFLEYKSISVGGAPAPAPQRSQVDTGRLGPSMQLIQEADNFIQAATAVYDPSLGRVSAKERSGKAILASQDQSNAATSNYLANMADISMTYEAKVILDLIPAIYDREGRVARILDLEGESSSVILNAPFYHDPRTKRPTMVQPGQMPPQGTAPKHFDLSKGRYGVSVTVGKTYQTRLEQGATEIGAILQSDPALMPLIGPTYFKFRDFPGSNEIAELLKKLRQKTFPGLDAGDENSPEAAQAKAEALQSENQQLKQALQQAGKMIETEQVKHQAAITMAQIKAETDRAKTQTDENIARQNNATKLAIARITAAKESMDAIREDQEESIALSQNLAHEAQEASEDRAHEVGMAGMQAHHAQEQAQMAAQQDAEMQAGDQAHDLGMAASGQAHDADMAASGQAHEQEMAQQAEAQADGAGV
jgi:hypothetical protein